MKKSENIKDLYKRKFIKVPDNTIHAIGHFNVFRTAQFVPKEKDKKKEKDPYLKRDYYKVILNNGGNLIHYADKVIETKGKTLVFSNSQIPYRWEHLPGYNDGILCIFDAPFFHNHGKIDDFSVFQPSNNHVFKLTDEEYIHVEKWFLKMLEEINSDYEHKESLLRTLTYEVIHFAMKKQPTTPIIKQIGNASQRITSLFLALLDRQFPIDENHQTLKFRTPTDFANQLNVHVNHLNRAVKEITFKTTTQHITERILQEAKILLKHADWDISEIAFALQFKEATHFSNFFKKHIEISPTQFRKG